MSESTSPRVVKGMPSVELGREEFERRFRERHRDPLFDGVEESSPPCSTPRGRLQRVPQGTADAQGRARVRRPELRAVGRLARRARRDRRGGRAPQDSTLPGRMLVINGSARSDQTCPGEMSKTYRLAKQAQTAIENEGCDVDFLDLSRARLPSTAASSIRARHACRRRCRCATGRARATRITRLGQTQDWMNEIYPRWVAAHGV